MKFKALYAQVSFLANHKKDLGEFEVNMNLYGNKGPVYEMVIDEKKKEITFKTKKPFTVKA